MLYLIGHKSISLKKETSTGKCNYCGSENSVTVTVYQKYVHFFRIPFLPAGKTGISECSVCNKVLYAKEMPENLLSIYLRLKSETRIPIWMFTGAIVFGLLFIYLEIQERNQHQQSRQLISAPAIGDVFEVKNSDQQYTLTKIIGIKKDSVFLVSSNYQSKDARALTSLKDSSYSEEVTYISKTELKALFEKGEILKVDRK
jgi:hypothetical protein